MNLLRLRLIGPGTDAAEFVDVGVPQLGQRGEGRLAPVSAAAVDQNGRSLFRTHFSSFFTNSTYRKKDSAGEMARCRTRPALDFCPGADR